MSMIESGAKAQKLKRLLAEGMNRQKALQSIGYAEKTAKFCGKRIVDRLLKKDSNMVQNDKLSVSDHLERLGYDDKSIAKVLADGLSANKIISAKIMVKGNAENKEATSITDDFIEVPDHPTRGQFVDRVAKLIGRDYYKDPKVKIDHSGSVTHRYESIIALITDTNSDEDFIDIEISEPAA